jgi:hypothetical protein
MEISFIQRSDGLFRLKIPKEVVLAHKIESKTLYNVTIGEIEE